MDKIISVAAAITTATSETIDYSVEKFGNAEVALIVTAWTGTTPTLDVDVEVSYDEITWFTSASFTQATGATTWEILDVAKRWKFMRFTYTIWGTTPSFDFKICTITKND